MSKEVIEKLIMENNRKIRILTEQAMNFVLTDYYFTILLEIKKGVGKISYHVILPDALIVCLKRPFNLLMLPSWRHH